MKSPIAFIIFLIFIILVLLYFCFVLQDKNRRLKRIRKMLYGIIDEKQKEIDKKETEINSLLLWVESFKNQLSQKKTLDTDRKSNI